MQPITREDTESYRYLKAGPGEEGETTGDGGGEEESSVKTCTYK